MFAGMYERAASHNQMLRCCNDNAHRHRDLRYSNPSGVMTGQVIDKLRGSEAVRSRRISKYQTRFLKQLTSCLIEVSDSTFSRIDIWLRVNNEAGIFVLLGQVDHQGTARSDWAGQVDCTPEQTGERPF